MHELRRMAYLQALGVDSYISRRALPGAAPSRRLAVVRSEQSAAKAGPTATPATEQRPLPAAPGSQTGRNVPSADVQGAATSLRAASSRRAPAGSEEVRFSLSTIAAGPFLWLESLASAPSATEQVALVHAMARALLMAGGRGRQAASIDTVDRGRFDWPMHNNQQLDNGREAATAGLTAFLLRRIERMNCAGLVVLGAECRQWVPADALPVPVVTTLGTAEILSEPASKPRVWRDLAPLREIN